jgi:D-3-phosphoglycerate dehydrogenase
VAIRPEVNASDPLRAVVAGAAFPTLDSERRIFGEIGAQVIDARVLGREDVLELCLRADAVLSDYFDWNAEAIGRLERCRVICQYGVGLDQIDIEAASAAHILVTHTPEYCVDELAEHTIALVLAASRQVARYDRSVRAGQWDYTVGGPMRRLRGQTLGLVGFGRVGREVAARAHGFGLRIIACDPYQPAKAFAAVRVEVVSFEDLLAEADILSLHLPLTPETREIIGKAELESMKRGGILVNTARGALVDQEALADALESGQLGAAALDVLAEEPPASSERLLRLENVTLTPHAGFLSVDSLAGVQTQAAEEVRRVLMHEPGRYVVNADVAGSG